MQLSTVMVKVVMPPLFVNVSLSKKSLISNEGLGKIVSNPFVKAKIALASVNTELAEANLLNTISIPVVSPILIFSVTTAAPVGVPPEPANIVSS